MKKIISIFAFALVAMSASAENLYKESKFFDNWYVGIQGGVASPAVGHAFWKDARGAFGVNVGKQLTPVYGLELEYTGVINTACSGNGATWASLPGGGYAIDYTVLTLNSTVNLMNLFGGYKGQPRLFEIQAVAGTGWGHSFLPGPNNDANDVVFKFGANFNFNIGKEKAWTVAFKPAILYDFVNRELAMTARAAQIQLFAGVTYHFKNSNGTHSFAFGRGYDQAEVDRLNATINETRGMVADRDQTIAAKNQRIARQRAEAVKTMLINKYKIAADRISAEGQGVGNSFSEPDWNRVSICTIQE